MKKAQQATASSSAGIAKTKNRLVIEALYKYFVDGAYHKMERIFHPDVIWIQMDGFPGGGVYSGIDVIIQQVFKQLKSDWDNWKVSVESLVEAKGAVFVIGQYSGRYTRTGKTFTADFIHHYQFKKSRIICFRQYTDTAQIVKATVE